MILTLAFVPPGDVVDYFNILENNLPEEADPVVEYFEEYYIGRLRQNGHRRTPLFPHRLWNIHEQTLEARDRTNKVHEGWHRRFAAQVTCYHPIICKFIDCLKAEQKSTEQRSEQLLAGDADPSRRKYDLCDKRLRRLLHTFLKKDSLLNFKSSCSQFGIQCC